MAQSVVISDDMWDELSQVARREKRQPQALVTEILRGYLESESDEALFREMQGDLGGREMSDQDAVDLVHEMRRERASRR